MSDLVAIAYESEADAGAAAEDLRALATEHQIELDDLALVTRDDNAALFILFHDANPDKILPEVGRHGGEVLRTSLSNEAEETLRSALSGARQPV